MYYILYILSEGHPRGEFHVRDGVSLSLKRMYKNWKNLRQKRRAAIRFVHKILLFLDSTDP